MSCGTFDPSSWDPSRAAQAGLRVAARLHLAQTVFTSRAGTGRCDVKRRAGCRAGCQKGAAHGAGGGSPSPPHWWGGALGAATQRGTKPALGSGAYKPPDGHSSATRDTHTRTRTGPRSALPGGHRRRRRGGQEEVGVKALAWHQAEPPRPGAPWAAAEGRSRRALPHRLLPLTAARDAARGGGGDPRGVTSPLQRISPRVPQTAKRTEKCLEKRETPRKPTPDKSSTSPPCPEHPCWPRATPQRKGGPGPGPAGVGGTQSTQARPIPALYTKA